MHRQLINSYLEVRSLEEKIRCSLDSCEKGYYRDLFEPAKHKFTLTAQDLNLIPRKVEEIFDMGLEKYTTFNKSEDFMHTLTEKVTKNHRRDWLQLVVLFFEYTSEKQKQALTRNPDEKKRFELAANSAYERFQNVANRIGLNSGQAWMQLLTDQSKWDEKKVQSEFFLLLVGEQCS